jgi:hypothetical protein
MGRRLPFDPPPPAPGRAGSSGGLQARRQFSASFSPISAPNGPKLRDSSTQQAECAGVRALAFESTPWAGPAAAALNPRPRARARCSSAKVQAPFHGRTRKHLWCPRSRPVLSFGRGVTHLGVRPCGQSAAAHRRQRLKSGCSADATSPGPLRQLHRPSAQQRKTTTTKQSPPSVYMIRIYMPAHR